MKQLIKLFLLVFIFQCSFVSLQAQIVDSINTYSYNKKREKIAALITYKFEIGEYDEALNLSVKYSNVWNKKDLSQPSENVQQMLIQARAQYVLLRFEETKQLVGSAEKVYYDFKNILSVKEKILIPLYVSNFYFEIGDYLTAQKFATIADSNTTTKTSEYLKNDILVLKAKIFFKQEYLEEAISLLDKQAEYRLKMATTPVVEKKDQLYINLSYDYKIRKERYAELENLRTSILIKEEMFAEADRLIANNKDWIQSNLGKSSIYYRELLSIEANRATLKKQNGKAAVLFQSAYTQFNCQENESNKINNLSETIIAYTKTNDIVRSQNYLRRLQMYAFQNLGKSERFHLAYDYTLAYKLYLEGQLEAASTRIDMFLTNKNGMPDHHAHFLKIKELQLLIARKANDVKALRTYENELALIKGNYFGKNTPAYHKALLTIAVEEIGYGSRFNYAEEVFKKSYDGFLRQKIQTNSKENSFYLSAYAELYLKLDRFDSAMAKSKLVAAINRNVYGGESSEYALALANFSEYSILAGKYQIGLDSLKKAKLLSESKSGDILVKQKTLLTIARLYKFFGEYDKIKELNKEVKALNSDGPYEQDILVQAEMAEQLSDMFIQTENYSEAQRVLKKSLVVLTDALGPKSPKLIPVYFGYTRFNITSGNLNHSDLYLDKSKQLVDSIYGENSIMMSEYYLLAGDYYTLISDFKRAAEAFQKADNIQSKRLGKKHLKRAETLLSLATLYTKQGLSKATDIEKLYKEALEIVKSTIGVATPLYAEIEEEYSEFLIRSEFYDQADKLLEEAEKFWTSKLGNENRHNAYINLLRGDVAYAKNKFDEAEKKYLKSKKDYASIFSENHPGYIKSVGKLARVYYMKKQTDKCLEAMNEIIPKYLEFTRVNFSSLSFRQKNHYCKDLKDEFEFFTFVALQQNGKDANLKYTGKVYNNVLATKALLLSSSIKLLDKIQNSKDSVLISLYNQWIFEKENMVGLLALSKSQLVEQGISIAELQSSTESLEKQMSQRSELFNKEKIEKQITWENVREKLLPNEYAIEIIRYRYFNKEFTDSVIYAALIINKNSSEYPDLVVLPNGKKMESRFLKYYRNTVSLNTPDENSYDVFWKPIKNKIPDGALVYISSDGVYNQINLEMLPVKGTEDYVIDQNKIVLLTNTKDLLLLEDINVSKKKSKEQKKVNNENYVFCGSPVFYTNSRIIKKNIPELPGAEKELVDLNTLLASSEKSSSMILKTNISEDTIKKLVSPKVLHIATHGYFKESLVKGVNEDDIATHPLLNSGLMLLGSGDIVDNPDNKYVNQKDGILTAYEAMDLTLDNTDIVILSACETGRGEVQVGEGVYGLQRSFLIAGAKAIVISLFKVNDDVTQKFMILFYKKWLKSGDKRQAFSEAKKEIKQQYKNPLYWGSFIMIEGRPERVNSNNN